MAVQKAFDTLTDIPKRRAYDSSLEFDDTIPGAFDGRQPDQVTSHPNVLERDETRRYERRNGNNAHAAIDG